MKKPSFGKSVMVFALFIFTGFVSACGTLDIASYEDVVLIDKRVNTLSCDISLLKHLVQPSSGDASASCVRQQITNLKGHVSCWDETISEKNTTHDPETGEVTGFKCRK